MHILIKAFIFKNIQPILIRSKMHFAKIACSTDIISVPNYVQHLNQELLTLPHYLGSPPVFTGAGAVRSLVFYVVFCRSLFIFFVWPLCCLFFYHLRLLIASLVSSNFFSNIFSIRFWNSSDNVLYFAYRLIVVLIVWS